MTVTETETEQELTALEAAHPDRRYLRHHECDLYELAKGRAIFNGCTTVWLCERHGAAAVRHHRGVGWYLVNPDQTELDLGID